jgi:hypothetical protein
LPSQQWNAYGYRLRFEWDDPEFRQVVESVVLPDWEEDEAATPDATFRLLSDGPEKVQLSHLQAESTSSVSRVRADQELKRICHLDLATYAPDLVFIHAGVVQTDSGLLVLPARSYSGKSTLVEALVQRGARFYSDEYAIVDSEGRVRPFPRPHCKRLSGEENRMTPAVEMGWTRELPAAPVSAVVATRYAQGEVWEPSVLSSGQAVVRLLENTVSARTEPSRAMAYLARMVERAVCVEGPRGECEEAAEAILEWVSSS